MLVVVGVFCVCVAFCLCLCVVCCVWFVLLSRPELLCVPFVVCLFVDARACHVLSIVDLCVYLVWMCVFDVFLVGVSV